jgi:8-oxo-dGTP diphosphatase
MGERPLAIAVSAVMEGGRILLIRRARGSYAGLMGLPGGKIEIGEHASEAAVREVLEESGIASEVRRFAGIVSEHETEGGKVVNHFLLFLFELDPKSTEIAGGSEGELEWVDLRGIEKLKDRIIPSDFEMIGMVLGNKDPGYYDCVLEKSGDSYQLGRFSRIG